ncbi:growth-blocking peptide, long form-like [Cydia pomonella]|uniref:growth-blocking peptide, long form-like n=1 Tax=Cydia pomonella TaxID=82600 RepID=UPI002ADD6E72|nr:growth-blocking peptide, long form-like [Cydia pomonella]
MKLTIFSMCCSVLAINLVDGGVVKEDIKHLDVNQIWGVYSDDTNKANRDINAANNGVPLVTQGNSKVTETTPIYTPTTLESKVDQETTTEKGRENFKGGCQTGYKRTADGRCMPVA